MAIIFSSQAIGSAMTFLSDVDQAIDSCASILTIIQRQSKIDARQKVPGAVKDVNLSVVARLNDVKFSYPNRPQQRILRGLSCETQPGKTLAIVGASGSGKSTIISLVQRLYDVDEGSVALDEVDVRDYDLEWMRRQMSVVPQEPILFNRSILDNIRYGYPNATMEEVEVACAKANCLKFIQAFPDGFNTNVGEGGSQMSGGQKQRVAIARALVRQPKLLLLDEATSALDNESERLVQDALEAARKDSTTIVIAHRLTTVQGADEIIVVENGTIVERGQHGDLVAKKGKYFTLVQHQLLVAGQ